MTTFSEWIVFSVVIGWLLVMTGNRFLKTTSHSEEPMKENLSPIEIFRAENLRRILDAMPIDKTPIAIVCVPVAMSGEQPGYRLDAGEMSVVAPVASMGKVHVTMIELAVEQWAQTVRNHFNTQEAARVRLL
jgi:hypothetical protein